MKPETSIKTAAILLAIAILGIYLRFDGIGFGLPLHFHRDEVTIIENGKILVDEARILPKFFWYPPLTIYLSAATYKIFETLGHLGVIIYNDSILYLAMRHIIALTGIFTILTSYLLGKTLFNESTGLISALLVAVSPLAVRNSHYTEIHTPTGLLTTLTIYFLLRYVKDAKGLKPAILSFLAALTVNYAAVTLIIPLFTAVITRNKERIFENVRSTRRLRTDSRTLIQSNIGKTTIRLILLACILAVASYLKFPNEIKHFIWEMNTQLKLLFLMRETGITAPSNYLQFFIEYCFIRALGLAPAILSIAGLTLIRKNRLLAVIDSWIITYLVFLTSISLKYARYTIPMNPFLLVYSAAALEKTIGYATKRIGGEFWEKFTATAIVALVVLIPFNTIYAPLPKSVEFNRLTFKNEDTRTKTARWTLNNIPAESKIVRGDHTPDIERLGKDYNVIPVTGENEIYFYSNNTGWLIDNQVEYAIFSDIVNQAFTGDEWVNNVTSNFFNGLDVLATSKTHFSNKPGYNNTLKLILEPGYNTLRIHASSGCTKINETKAGQGGSDVRCISIGYKKIRINEKRPPTTIATGEYFKAQIEYNDSWHSKEEHEDVRWMSENSSLTIINPNEKPVAYVLRITGRSYLDPRKTTISAGSVNTTHIIDRYGSTINLSITAPPGETSIYLKTVPGCEVVAEREGGEDVRCLSLGVSNITVKDKPEEDMEYGRNWWPYIPEEGIHWMSQDSEIIIHNPYARQVRTWLSYEALLYTTSSTIEYTLNADYVGTDIIPSKNIGGPAITIYSIPGTPGKGINLRERQVIDEISINPDLVEIPYEKTIWIFKNPQRYRKWGTTSG